MLSEKVGIEDIGDKLSGKRVLMRVDFNVPIEQGVVTDKTRIVSTIPTIKYIFENGAKCLILMSHCGRPDGCRQLKYSLLPVVDILENLSGRKVTFLSDCVGPSIESRCSNPENGSLILLENLRFHVEEEGTGKDPDGKKIVADDISLKSFRESLTKLGDIYVNDAFGSAHRPHSSIVGISLPIRAAGLLMKKELNYFSKALDSPQKPFLAILGGAKIRDKIKLIKNLLEKVDMMIIGGGMAYTFKKVINNMPIGKSLFDEEGAKIVSEIMTSAKDKKVEILLPVDFVCADKFEKDATVKLCDDSSGIPDGWIGMDCGNRTVDSARKMILRAKTIVWNGPQGVFEMEKFSAGSVGFLNAVIEATKNGAISIVGGGDTAAFVESVGKSNAISHVSTGGGASLELLEGNMLPGITALSNKAIL